MLNISIFAFLHLLAKKSGLGVRAEHSYSNALENKERQAESTGHSDVSFCPVFYLQFDITHYSIYY